MQLISSPRVAFLVISATLLLALPDVAQAQAINRVPYNNQEIFLSGGNVAWINFARDIGPGTTDLDKFGEIFQQLHDNGGNSMRLWLHTTGAASPAWSGNVVTGPGADTIEDLRAILDLAWQNEIGLMLCLWSFDMLRTSNGATITDRAFALLTDSSLTRTYIDNALVPMVDSLKGHPGIVAWEIFNEPEGMSNEFGWDFNRHVAMNDIQRFINMTTGAIHRTDSEALVTNGSWAFLASSDETPAAPSGKTAAELSDVEVERLRSQLSYRYRYEFSSEAVRAVSASMRSRANVNYYRDDRLIAAGGDSLGVIDFYTVHYYEWAGPTLSPFHQNASVWGLTKPLAIAEFFMGGGDDGNNNATFGIPYQDLYKQLYQRGYAGALAWQWFNYPTSAEGVVNWPRILESTQQLFDLYPIAVDINPGLRIARFDAEPPGIEAGQSSQLSWSTSGADSVTLNGESVDSVGTLVVSPLVTTEYELQAVDSSVHDTVSLSVTVTVLDPDQINRARLGPAFASTVEVCCGNDATPNLAVDGNQNTRWSSEWQDGFADSDPDDEWLYVDLGVAIAIDRVVLYWEAAFGADYNIDVSYDSRTWTTVHQEVGGTGGTDEVVFASPPSGRYVRMHGIDRGTQYGYSLWEFEVYGLVSNLQPPSGSIALPGDGAVFAPGNNVTMTVDATDPDGLVAQVEFFVDGVPLAVDTDSPFSVAWLDVAEGEYVVSAVVTDDDAIAIVVPPVPVYVFGSKSFVRYEAESSAFSGEITSETTPAASGGSFLDMRDSGSIKFDNVVTNTSGEYWLVFRYNLQYDVPKFQYVIVNGDTLPEVRFNGNLQSWQRRATRINLAGGTNSIEILKHWGWMYFDYIEVSAEVVDVDVDEANEIHSYKLEPLYPNPSRGTGTVSYTIERSEAVRLEMFDVTGRQISVLVDAVQSAGSHSVAVHTDGLASGIYFFRISAGDFLEARSFVVMQ